MAAKNVVELLRVSTEAQAHDDRGGIPAQRRACEDIARREGLTLKPDWLIRIDGVSGAVAQHTKEIEHLRQILKSGECYGVVMKEESRLMRPDDFEAISLAQIFKSHGVKLFTADTKYDLSNPHDQFMFMVKIGMAGYELSVIAGRMQGGRREIRDEGGLGSPANTLPYGLCYERIKGQKVGRWYWDQAKSAQIQRLFELFISGTTSYSQLAKLTGLSLYQIAERLANSSYMGVRTYHEKLVSTGAIITNAKGKPVKQVRKVELPPEDVKRIVLPCGGIVSEDIFARAQQLLALKRDGRWRRNNVNDDRFTYRGFLRCGICGQLIITIPHRKKKSGAIVDYYHCRNAHGDRGAWNNVSKEYTWRIKSGTCEAKLMRRDRLEPILDELISGKLSDPDFLYGVIETMRRKSQAGTNKRDAERITKEITSAQDRANRLKRLFVIGDLSEDEYTAARNTIAYQIKGAQDELARLVPVVPQVSGEHLAGVAGHFKDWKWLDRAERRALLTAAVPVFRVSGIGNGGRGNGSKVEIRIDGFYLMLTGDGPGPEGGAGVKPGNGKKSVARETRINIELPGVVSNQYRSRTEASSLSPLLRLHG